MFGNVKTFLWRTLYLQGIRRHYIATAIEIALVGLLFLMLAFQRELAQPLSKDTEEVDASSAFTLPQVTDIVYAPKNDYNDGLMRAVGDEISRRWLTKIVRDVTDGSRPEPSSGRLERGAHVVGSLNGAGVLASDDIPAKPGLVKLHPLTDGDAVIKKCKQLINYTKASLKPTKYSIHPLCVNVSGPASDSASLALTLYAPVETIFPGMTDFQLGSFSKAKPSFDEAVTYQQVIEQEHLKLQSKHYPQRPMDHKVSIGVMPGWVFEGLDGTYEPFLFVTVYLAFIIPMIRRINAIEQEFSTGTAEHQCVMGLSDAEFFWGHYLTVLIIGLVESFLAVAIMFLQKHDGHTYAEGMDLGLVTVSFVMFQIGYSMLIILLTWVFPKGWVSLIIGILIGLVVPDRISETAGAMSLANYFIHSRKDKLLASVLPNSALCSIVRIICIARDYEGGASWSLVTRRVLGKDSVTIAELWTVMVICDIVMAFLAWYLSKVLPWSTDNRQSPVFCLMPSYWKSEGAVDAARKTVVKQDAQRFEELPPDIKTVIATDNLTKVYGHKPALNGVNLKVYESRITVLLGHNGAGKTTMMSILTGMQAPTSGAARICGFNVASQRDQVRQRVSLCQQTDIFFDDMTCAENLLYFGSLKGGRQDRLLNSIQETLHVVGLEDKAYSMPSQLSGGMKRRLSIAMTLVSDPELLILDEPTAGMDPETRRCVWDTLQNVGKKKTLLLSSHDMEEADAIADQIIIMASGVVVCSGSTAFLKKTCGVGYKLTFAKVANEFKLNDVMNIVRTAAPAATVDDDKMEEVSIALGTLDNKAFPTMFTTLESSLRRLGIASIGVTVASMKDVYLKINLDWAPGGREREHEVEGRDIDGVCKPITKRSTMTRSFGALFRKRLLSLLRSWDLFIAFFLVPLSLLVFFTWGSSMARVSSQSSESHEGSLDILVNLGVHFPEYTTVIGESPATNVSRNLRVLLESQGGRVVSVKDVGKDLREVIEEDFSSYINDYAMIVEFKLKAIRMMPNPTSPLARPMVVNLVDTARLRALTAQPKALINVTITYMETEDIGGLVNAFLTRIVSWINWSMTLAMTYSLAFAAYSSFPVAERLSGARDVQLMTGISGAEFIFAHFTFDFLHHVLFSVLWCAVHYGFSSYPLSTAGLFLLAFLSSGPLAIGFAYLTAETAGTASSAVGRIFLTFFVGGAVTATLKAIIWIITFSTSVDYVACLYGPYALLSMLMKVWNDINKSEQCKMMRKSGHIVFASILGINCDARLLEFSNEGIGFELSVVLVEGLVFLAIIIFVTSGYLGSGDALAPMELPAEEDVEEEKKRVNAARQQEGLAGHSLLAWSLHKRFGQLSAVRGVYMALRPSECFGLLGVNGAGKTTTFQMLAGLTSVSYGDACTAVAKLSGNVRKWQSQVSYCFQLGGLLDRLNAYEYLYLIGRLRGIPEHELKPMVDSIISVVDLVEHASKECGVYSGGNRRKLSIGAALLGLQPFVFLDEPYAGVDVVSRNKIFRAIAEIKKRSRTTFVLTSHNMDECEFSCDRITIMVSGQMTCLGTLQRLREKFGQGYRLEFLLKHTAAADAPKLKQAVAVLFPKVQLKDDNQNLLSYHLMERIPWSELFTKVGQLQQDFALEHVLVGENTLEDIFLNFARTQGTTRFRAV